MTLMDDHRIVAGLYICNSIRGGRGVFTALSRRQNEILNLTYSWTLSPEDLKFIDKTTIEGYWFDHPTKKGWGLMPIGLAALVNCSLKPNSTIKWIKTDVGYVGRLRALMEISEHEEILIDYGIGLEPGWIS